MPKGKPHLACLIDWCLRHVVGRRLADDMGTAGACACVGSAFGENGAPSILNSDQGSVFNSVAYEGLLASEHVRQSMDGKARWVDDVIVGRWFRSLTTECLGISEHDTPAALRRLIQSHVDQHDNARRHQSLGCERPESWRHSGLYNIGVMVGDMYATTYKFCVGGHNLSACCTTFPYLLAQEFAGME